MVGESIKLNETRTQFVHEIKTCIYRIATRAGGASPGCVTPARAPSILKICGFRCTTRDIIDSTVFVDGNITLQTSGIYMGLE